MMIKTGKITLEKLALMMAKGFEDMQNQFQIAFQRLDNLEEHAKNTNYRLTRLEQGQEDIILRLDNKADKIDLPGYNPKRRKTDVI